MAGLLDDTSGFGGLLGNPLFNAGLGILAASGRPGATFGGAVGQGGLLGMQNFQQAQQAAGANQLRQMQLAEMQRQQAARAKLSEAMQAAALPQTQPGFNGAQLTAFSDQYDPGVAGARAPVSNVAGQLSQPQTVAPDPAMVMKDPRVKSALFAMDPMAAASLYAKDETPVVLPKGGTLVNRSGKTIAQGAPDLPTGMVMGANGPEYLPGYISGQATIRRAGQPITNIDMKQDSAEASAYGQQLVKEYTGIAEAANAAQQQRNQIRMARAFSDQDASGNPLPSVLQQKAGNAAAALGFNVESPAVKSVLGNISNGQSFVGTMQNLVLTKMQAQKGPQTENDAKRIEQTVASLGNTPEARDFLMRSADALAFEDVLKRQHYDEFKTSKGSFQGAAQSWSNFRSQVPFMGISPNTGKPVFFAEFYEANRGKPMNDVIQAWRGQYGR